MTDLWEAVARPKVAAMRRAYRGVHVAISAEQGVPLLEAIAVGRSNIVAQLLIDAMAEQAASKDRWWAWNESDRQSDEAGRWWTSNRGSAQSYAMQSEDDAWMSIGVVMTVELNDDDPQWGKGQPIDGTYWHIDAGTPLTIIAFEAVLPDRASAQHLLDTHRATGLTPSDEGEETEDGFEARWEGALTRLSIPPMRTMASMRDVAYRGVQAIVTEEHGVPMLEAIVKGQRNVAHRLLLDAMAQAAANKNHWWAAGAQDADEAGRFWTNRREVAQSYAMDVFDDEYWMIVPVVMMAEFDDDDPAWGGSGDDDITNYWHIDAGTPLNIVSFDAALPDRVEAQRLLDDWRGISSPGNFDKPAHGRWDGQFERLNVPPMRTTAAVYDDRCTNTVFRAITGLSADKCLRYGTSVLEAIVRAGFGYEVLGSWSGGGGVDYYGMTLRKLVQRPELQHGAYYVSTAGHALAFIDGVLTDTEERGPDGRRVQGVYRITGL